MRRRSVLIAVAALAAPACSGSDDTATSTSVDQTPTVTTSSSLTGAASTTASTTTTSAPPDSTAPTSLPPPTLDIGADLVMFAPVPPRPADRPDLPLPDGSDDFYELFEQPDRWAAGLAELDVFKLHGWMIKHYLTDAQLVLIDDVLRRHDVPLMIEAEPLAPPDPTECDHTESFEGPYELESLRRLRDLGVGVAAVAIEQPLHMAHLLTGPGACQYSLDRIFDELVVWRDDVRSIYPDAEFGTIEAVWDITTTADYERWHDGWLAASGEPFAFQHLDINWLLPSWIDTTLAIEDVVEARGIPFGILYNGGLATTSDEFIRQTMLRVAEYEAAGGSPAHTMFQSWVEVPDRVLPDDETSGFSHLIRRYRFGPSRISADAAGEAVRGRIGRADGSGAEGIAVTATALAIGGARQTFTATVDAPAGATEAFVVVRVNGEDALVDDVSTTVHDVSVTQDGSTNLLPYGTFDRGLEGWGVYDTNSGSTTIVSDGDAAMVLVADSTEEVWIDGSPFPITGGAAITLTVDATLGSPGEGGRIALIFPNADIEQGRLTLPMMPTPIEAGTATTASDGSFEITLSALPPGVIRLRLGTDGDATTWPASTEIDVTVS